MAVNSDEIEIAFRKYEETKFSRNTAKRDEARKEYENLLKKSSDENWDKVRKGFAQKASHMSMSIAELENALRDPVVADLAKKELERRAREEAREKREQEKRDRTNEYRSNLIQLDKIVEIINLIGLTEENKINDLYESFPNNKNYHISLVNTEKHIEFKVMISNGKVFQIAIAFNPYEDIDGFYDPISIVQNTTFSICFSRLGKHIYFVGKTNTSHNLLAGLTTDQLIKELTPCDVNNTKLSWDYASKNKDIMPTQSDIQFIINMLNDTIGTKDSSEGVITQNKI